MRGEFIGVWSETWREIWNELAFNDVAPDDLFCELYRELTTTFKVRPTVEALAEIIDSPARSKQEFEMTQAESISGERALVSFLETAQAILDDLGGDALSNDYFNLLEEFISKFSLRYDLRRPCTLCPTLPGVFASLMRELRRATSQDAHLDALMKDFENAIRDLRTDCSDARIKTCILKQLNLLEGLGKGFPGVTESELAGICNQITTWPHSAIKASLKNLYGFASDYPGIRHGGNPDGAIRNIDMRDMIAVSILLAGFTPYLSNGFSGELVYRGLANAGASQESNDSEQEGVSTQGIP